MSSQFDVLIRDTTIIDGTGSPAYRGSVGIKGEQVAAVGDVSGSAETVIDGGGLVTCPGFIDPHSHADISILKYPLAHSKLMQGITTFVGGNCGSSLAPVQNDFTRRHVTRYFSQDVHWKTFADYLSAVDQTRPSVNMAVFVGHNPIRSSVMGEDFKRKATGDEVRRMQQHVQEAMDAGALGFTTGLDSSFGEYADLDEIAPLAAVAGRAGGMYATHIRHNQTQWPADTPEEFGYGLFHGPVEDVWIGRYRGYAEAVEVGRRAGLPVHISHLAYAYAIPQPHPDFLAEAVAKATLSEFVDKPRAEGVKVTFDTIFAPASIATPAPLATAFQNAHDQFGKAGLLEKLASDEFRGQLRRTYDSGKMKMGMIHPKADPFWVDCFQIVAHRDARYQGQMLGDIFKALGGHPVDVLSDLILADPDAVWSQVKDKKRTLPGLLAFLEHPECIPCTDTFAYSPDPDPHDYKAPAIAYGMYPSFLETYVRQLHALSLEQAIYRATGLPAKTFGLKGRGVLQPGAYADVLVFDFDTIHMTGDSLQPARPPEGIRHVLVNGSVVYQNKQHTGAQPGRVLRRQSMN